MIVPKHHFLSFQNGFGRDKGILIGFLVFLAFQGVEKHL